MTDPISDMLTRIRNAIALGRTEVTLPHSKLKADVANVLMSSGFLSEVKVNSSGKFKELEIKINDEIEVAKITEIKRLSRPGQRHYVKAPKIPKVRRGRGIVVVSTSRGIMAGEDARRQNLGGELICEVY